MPSRRAQKAAEAIRGIVSMAILAELKDPRVRDVTVTYVEVSDDLRTAKVHVSVMGDETHQNLTLRGLQSAAGFLQAKIAEGVEIRYTPKLTFLLDQGVKRSIAIAQILREVMPPAETPHEAGDDAADEEETSHEETDLPRSPDAGGATDAGREETR
jgi:ribosome-binding factor A